MARLSRLENNFERDYRDAFEDMATHMLVAEFHLPRAPLRRKNQAGIEADPVVRDDGRSFAYQAKYLEARTEAKSMEEPFKSAVREASDKGATDLVFYLNKQLTQDPLTKEPPQWELRVTAEAKRARVRLHWRELSRIEAMLGDPNRPDYGCIRNMYLGGPLGEDSVVGFYRDACEQYFGDAGSELYGDVPLSECYIEPTVDVGGDFYPRVREWVESFVCSNGKVAVLCGEPGHGKTSLCRKAVTDFYKAGWLAGRVSNVFCFSLNPANTDALSNRRLNLYSLLSWGGDRTDRGHKVKARHCKNALVFLDAFDELLEWHPAFDLAGFVRDHVLPFQRETGARVVVTTRSMVVDPDANTMRIRRRTTVPVLRLRPITKEQQLGWIDRYARHLRGMLADVPESPSYGRRAEIGEELDGLETYAKRYGKLDVRGDLRNVLGVPIIFRMVVAARYLPKTGESITRMYDDLFDATWERHAHEDDGSSTDPREEARARLSRHALRVYADDADTAVVGHVDKSPWTFSFYTKHKKGGDGEGISRVGFLHRSFYQHFLACEVISWFMKYADKTYSSYGKKALRNDLSYLARRRLDETTLGYVREMHNNSGNKDGFGVAFDKVCAILKETDGFLSLPKGESDVSQIEAVSPLERANNVFWNVVSVCSVCGYELATDKVSALALRSYKLDDCHLERAHLEGANLSEACLSGTHLDSADLGQVNLVGSRLSGAYLGLADLSGADLSGADLEFASLRKAGLRGASLRRAILSEADLSGADLSGADLSGADLSGADLRGANLADAYLEGTRLEKANLGWAHFEGTDLRGARLGRANLEQVNLWEARLDGANLW